jgi:hypothetical protein
MGMREGGDGISPSSTDYAVDDLQLPFSTIPSEA